MYLSPFQRKTLRDTFREVGANACLVPGINLLRIDTSLTTSGLPIHSCTSSRSDYRPNHEQQENMQYENIEVTVKIADD